ncbi:MAG: hypothetical protein SO135_06895 [Sphaerochaetaceae bacterium]|nr:hypothetical protein [Sphaerochaetaceae bacterium]
MKSKGWIWALLALSVLCFFSCGDSNSQLLGIAISSQSKSFENDVDFYEVHVYSEDERDVMFRTPNSVFPSLLQISVPVSSLSVTVSSYKGANDDAVIVETGTSVISSVNSKNVEVKLLPAM